jgi:hypothetical protein
MSNFPRNPESGTLSKLAASVTELISSESPRISRMCLTLLLGIVLLTSGFLVKMGATVVLCFPGDIAGTLDGGWRVINGQIPHVDFYTPLGALTHLIVALGMRLGGPRVSSIADANACLLLVLAPWAWTIARTRMSPVLSLLFALYVGFMIAATSTYGHEFKQLGYSAIYNRYGIALTALVLIESLGCPRRDFRVWTSALQGVSTGICIATTFFLKPNFFGVTVLAVIAGGILLPQNRYRWCGLCAGAAVVTVVMLAYLRFDIAAMSQDMAMAAKIRGIGFIRSAFGMLTEPVVFDSVFLMLTLWCIAPCADGYYRSLFAPKIGQGLLVLFLILVQAMLSLTNSQPPLATLFPAGALLVLEAAQRAVRRQEAAGAQAIDHSTGWMATLLLALYFVASILIPDMESLPYSVFMRRIEGSRMTADRKFAAPPLADLLAPRDPEYTRAVNDGCELLRLYSQPSDRIVTMDLTNPFSFALQRPPATGDALWWDQHSFTKLVHPDAERVFEHAAVVMVPKKPITAQPERQPMAVYAGYIDAHYTLVTESAYWKLYRPRSN